MSIKSSELNWFQWEREKEREIVGERKRERVGERENCSTSLNSSLNNVGYLYPTHHWLWCDSPICCRKSRATLSGSKRLLWMKRDRSPPEHHSRIRYMFSLSHWPMAENTITLNSLRQDVKCSLLSPWSVCALLSGKQCGSQDSLYEMYLYEWGLAD